MDDLGGIRRHLEVLRGTWDTSGGIWGDLEASGWSWLKKCHTSQLKSKNPKNTSISEIHAAFLKVTSISTAYLQQLERGSQPAGSRYQHRGLNQTVRTPFSSSCLGNYGRWEALQFCKRVSRGVGVFSTIGWSIMRTFKTICFLKFSKSLM